MGLCVRTREAIKRRKLEINIFASLIIENLWITLQKVREILSCQVAKRRAAGAQ